MAQNVIDDVLDQLTRIKSGDDLNSFNIHQIEKLEMHLRFLRTFSKYNHDILPNFLVKITKKAKLIVKMLHSVFGGIPDECKNNLILERLKSQMLEFIEGNTSSVSNFGLNDDSDLSEYMDCLGKNLNDVLMCLELERPDPSSMKEQILQYSRVLKQVKIIQKKMRFLRYLYATEINAYIDHERLEGLETRIQFMADSVGQFCLTLFVNRDDTNSDKDEDDTNSDEDEDDTNEDEDDTNIDEDENDIDSDEDEDDTNTDEDENDIDSDEDEDDTNTDSDSDEDEDDVLSKPPYLLCLIVLVELEMKKIFLSELKDSKFTRSRTFKDKKLPKGFSYYLRNLLVYLRNEKLKNFPTNVTSRNIDVAIEFLLIFLGDVPNHVINGKRLNEVLEKMGVLVGDILCVIQMLLTGSTIKEDASKIDLGMIQILEKLEDLKAQVEERYKSLKYSSSQFPKVGGLSFLDSLIRKLNEMLKSESCLDFMMKPHIGVLEKELSSLTFVFRDVAKVKHKHNEILKDLQRRTVNLAYEAEVSIDSILVQYNALWHFFCSFPAILKEIKHIHVEVMEVKFKNLLLKPFYVVEPSKHLPAQHSNPVNAEEIVGFENESEKIIQYLIRGTNELDVIPIVGMGGQGKTTIARKVYNNEQIVCHFDCLAWCCISQTYNRTELLQNIFSQVTGSKDKVDEVGKTADMLRKSLMHNRYLIVLDDMWDINAWDDLRLSFPNDENGSRIIVTTRLEEVAKQVKYHTDPYSLPLLPLKESCKLLQKKVFQQKVCPPELQEVSLEIAEKCKGLPLVIILVAGIIKKRKMEASWWDEVKDSLLSFLGESEGYSLSTMQLSYDNLPDYLKPCLLYMGMFPEDANILVSELISLWIAEGLVQNIESGRLMEELAEGYLMDLISSNVVMVSRRRYNGKVKYCQVHDVVLHFCLEKSREERFMLAVKGHDSQFQPCDWKESRVSFSFSEELSKFVSLCSNTRKPFYQHLRSLITTNNGKTDDWNYPIRQVSEVRLLKVLDLGSHVLGPLWSATLKPLIHLKYLAVRPFEFHFHPKPHLPHLETLIVRCLDEFAALPAIFWKMEKLRHVEITEAVFDLEKNTRWIFEESSKLESLKILRNVRFRIRNADRVDVLLRRCPNLQELDISLWCIKYSSEICLKLESLTQLQILHLSFGYSTVVSELHLPSSLNKLVLMVSHIKSGISFIRGLPRLEYLQLWDFDHSKEWCLPTDITFHKLKVLKLVDFCISRWDASEESFPLLETLVIRRCRKLEEIPLSFADIPTLKQIQLVECRNKSLEASARRIKEEVEDTEGWDRLKLIIME